MYLHAIHDLSNSYIKLLLTKGLSKVTDETFLKNYHPDYSNESQNLFYILNDENGRYRKGCFYVLENKGEYICSAGWNELDTDSNTALLLTRMYTAPEHRVHYYHATYILPRLIEETKHYERQWVTMNTYNKKIYNWFLRKEEGKSPGLFNDWPDIYRNFIPIGKKTIYNTEQYVAEYRNELHP